MLIAEQPFSSARPAQTVGLFAVYIQQAQSKYKQENRNRTIQEVLVIRSWAGFKSELLLCLTRELRDP